MLSARSVSLQANQLNGTLPTTLQALSALSYLNTCGNNLTGEQPGWLSTMTSQQLVTLSQCGQSVVNCAAGYYCDGNSLSATANACPIGQYSLTGSGTCSYCAAGSFGNTTALPAPTCSGNCTAMYYCPAGSVTSTAVPCPAGQYSLSGWSTCIPYPVLAAELQSLVYLYTNTSGGTWKNNSGWSNYAGGSDPCSNYWYCPRPPPPPHDQAVSYSR